MPTKKTATNTRKTTDKVTETDLLVRGLLDNLDFQAENAVEESAKQAILFAKAVDYRMHCVRKLSAAKAKRDSARVAKSLRIRTKKQREGERVSEKYIEELVDKIPLIQKLEWRYALAKEKEEYSFLLLEAYRMRRDGLKNIANLVSSGLGLQNFMAENSEKVEKVREELQRKYR